MLSLRSHLVTVENQRLYVAGASQFRNVWVRDFAFSVGGLLASNETQAVSDTLELIASGITPEGLVPRLFDSMDYRLRVVLAQLGIKRPLTHPLAPSYRTENGVLSIDNNLLFAIAAERYLSHRATAGQTPRAQAWWPLAQKTTRWIQTHHRRLSKTSDALPMSLITDQPPYSDWADSVARTGSVGFTQVLWILHLEAMSRWALSLTSEPEATKAAEAYQTEAQAARRALIEYFWDEKNEILRSQPDEDRIVADVNWMALSSGVLEADKARRVWLRLNASRLGKPLPGRVASKPYSKVQKSLPIRFAGLLGYHDEFYWLWLSALALKAERRFGTLESWTTLKHEIEALLDAHGGVHEIYRESPNLTTNPKTGAEALMPVRTLAYRAEHPFAWSTAMLIESFAEGC